MNIFIFLPFLALVAPIVPAFVEIFRRKDKGPRKVPEQTLNEEEAETSTTIPMFEKVRAKARVKIAGEILRVVGDVSIPDGVEIKENIVVHGNLRLGSKCHIHGSIKTFGEVEVGEDSVIEGHMISEGKVTLGQNARVKGIIDSAGDIILKENTVVEAVSTEKSVRLASGAKVNRRILAGVSITAPSALPAAKEEEIQAEGAVKVTVPSFNTFFEGRTCEEAPEEVTPKGLSQREVEIYKLAVSGYNIDEIGLRLLIDPVQVRELINSLIKRAYLDEQLKPVRPEGAQEAPEEATAAIQPQRTEREKPEAEELPVEEVFERLLASKLRIEVKERLKGEQKEESAAKAEMKENLREWQAASSAIFGPEREEKKDHHNATNILKQAEKTDRKPSDDTRRCRETGGENASKPLRGRYWKGVLPISTLLSALLTEAAYYNPSLFLFLKGLVPPAFKIWMLFLGVTITLAMITGAYSAKSIFSSPKLRVE